MIELVLTVCLLTSPEDCRKERLAFEGPLFACVNAGQIAAAEWLATHPKYKLVRWSCGPARREA